MTLIEKFHQRWPSIKAIQIQARKEADSIAVRWDVPQGERYPGQPKEDPELYIEIEPGVWAIWPHDLRDTKPRLRLTAPDPETGEQGRVSGRMLPDDLLFGMPSSAIPILLALVPMAGLFLLLASNFGPWGYGVGLTVLGVVLAIVANATTGRWWFAAAVAGCLPLLKGMDAMADVKDQGAMGIGVTLAIVVGLALLFGSKRDARVAVGGMLGLALTLFAAFHLPDFLQPFALSLPACALPWGWAYWLDRTRGVELSVYGSACNYESSSKGLGHVNVRKSQTLRAAKGYSK